MSPKKIYRQLFLTTTVTLLLSGCSSSQKQESGVINPEKPIPMQREEIISPDTTLLNENVESWLAASKQKQLDNCAAVIYASLDTSEFLRNKDINEMSRLLNSCLYDVTSGMPTVHDDPIDQLISSCLKTLDFEAE